MKNGKNRLSKKDKRRIKKAVLAAAKKSSAMPNDLMPRLMDAFRQLNEI